MQHSEDPGSAAFHPMSPNSGDHYYPPSHGPKDERPPWNPHMAAYDHQVGQGCQISFQMILMVLLNISAVVMQPATLEFVFMSRCYAWGRFIITLRLWE